jgi:hypothetical protein
MVNWGGRLGGGVLINQESSGPESHVPQDTKEMSHSEQEGRKERKRAKECHKQQYYF